MDVCVGSYHDYAALGDEPVLAPRTFTSHYEENKAPSSFPYWNLLAEMLKSLWSAPSNLQGHMLWPRVGQAARPFFAAGSWGSSPQLRREPAARTQVVHHQTRDCRYCLCWMRALRLGGPELRGQGHTPERQPPVVTLRSGLAGCLAPWASLRQAPCTAVPMARVWLTCFFSWEIGWK